jgi:uncharacterized membrane protein
VPVRVVRYLLGVFFVFAGANHFISPDLYLEMMPSWLPLHGPAVFWSGVAEMAGGVMLFFDRTAKAGGVFLILILVAIFPANVNAAIDPAGVPWVESNGIPEWLLWLRLPLQPVLAALIWLATRDVSRKETAQDVPNSPSSPS